LTLSMVASTFLLAPGDATSFVSAVAIGRRSLRNRDTRRERYLAPQIEPHRIDVHHHCAATTTIALRVALRRQAIQESTPGIGGNAHAPRLFEERREQERRKPRAR
jgi:hypothetical protein